LTQELKPKSGARTSTELNAERVTPTARQTQSWPDPSAPSRKRSPSRKSRHTPSARRDAEIDAAIAEYTLAGTSVSRLRALGTRALFRLATSFPGPLDISELNLGDLPPPAAHGPLLRACIELGEAMVPHILELFDHRRYLVRFYAAFVFQDLRDGRCIRPLSELAFDQEASVRLIAMRVLETYTQEEDFERVVARIRKSLNSVDRPRRIQAIDALGTLRDIRSIPQLIDLLEATDTEVQDTALGALCSITAQQLGYRASRWRTWYAGHSDRSRIDWLIEGLRHRDPAVRRWVADELARISNQDIDFPANGDRRDREQAIKAWSAWWAQAQEAGLIPDREYTRSVHKRMPLLGSACYLLAEAHDDQRRAYTFAHHTAGILDWGNGATTCAGYPDNRWHCSRCNVLRSALTGPVCPSSIGSIRQPIAGDSSGAPTSCRDSTRGGTSSLLRSTRQPCSDRAPGCWKNDPWSAAQGQTPS